MREYCIKSKGGHFKYYHEVDPLACEAFPSLSKFKSGYKSDLASKLNGIQYLLNKAINYRGLQLNKYSEIAAGVGFSASLVWEHVPLSIHLSDNNQNCVNSLIEFKENRNRDPLWGDLVKSVQKLDYITDVAEVCEMIKGSDLLFADYSHFTANKADLVKVTKKYLGLVKRAIITDVYSFSLKPFDQEKYFKYLERLSFELGKYIEFAYVYRSYNAAQLYLTDKPPGRCLAFIEEKPNYDNPDWVKFGIFEKQGLFYT